MLSCNICGKKFGNNQDRCCEGILQPYSNQTEFITDLAEVLEKDYGITLNEKGLLEVSNNFDRLLGALL